MTLLKNEYSDLNLIKRSLNKYSDLFDKTISNFNLNNASIPIAKKNKKRFR